MTAATGRAFGPKPYGGSHTIAIALRYPLTASLAPQRNWLMGLPANGYAVAQAAGVVGLVSAGFVDNDIESGAANGDAEFIGRQCFVTGYANSSESLDTILFSDVSVPIWAVDNQTVGKKSNHGGVNRSLLGLALGIDDDTGLPIFYPGPIGWQLGRSSHIADAFAGAHFQIADSAAGTTTAEQPIPRKKVHGTIIGVDFTGVAVVASDTDYVTITVSKRDGAGGVAVSLATYDSRAANQGAVTAFVPASFALSAVAGALNLLETDVVTVTVAKGNAGKVLTGTIRVMQKVG
jgi:hypothetical protein